MRFSTDELPARDRFALFREGLVSRFAALELVRHDTIPFRGELSLLRAGAISVARLDTSPTSFLRTPKLLSDEDDSICLAICRRGRYHASQNENEQFIRPGDGLLLDVGRVAVIDALGANNGRWSIKIPRARLRAAVPSVDALGGCKIPAADQVQRLLFHYVEGAQRVGLAAGLPVAALFDDHVFDLVVCLLGDRGEAREIAERRGLRYARRQAILKEIETNFSDPGLSAAVVAARLGVTARYVHSLLEETGKTFSEAVLEQRLNRTMRLLTDSRRSRQTILAVALEAGFADLSHFNRSFRRRFGDTPSGARAGSARVEYPKSE